MSPRLRTLLVNGALLLLVAIVLAPLGWMLSVSLMDKGEAARIPAPLFPAVPTLLQYQRLFTHYTIGRPLLNSLIVASLSTVAGLAFMVPAGYAFAKLRFAGRAALFRLLLALLVVPGQVALLPLFLLMKQAGIINSYAAVVVPWMGGIFGTLFVRQAALSIPPEMLDAARVDGAGEGQLFVHVVLPVLRPVIVTLALFIFLGSWNDFLWPLIALSDQHLLTLPVALAALSREHGQDAELMMAGAVVTVLPVLLLFLPLQRFYIGGVLGGAIKG